MKRLAIFVEGYTEVLFLERLFDQICGTHNLVIEHRVIKGGGKSPRNITQVKASTKNGNEKYYVLIFDCMGDKLVAQRIREEHLSLTKNGYFKIIGIRDVRPDFKHSHIPKLETELNKYIKKSLIPVEFILSVLEVEAWFLSEYTHFEKIDPALNKDLILSKLGFDPSTDDMQQRLEPQNDLRKCYQLVNKDYIKSSETTVNALDYTKVYVELPARIPYLKKLFHNIDDFLS